MNHALDDASLDQLFGDARTHSHWLPQPVPDALLRRLYALLRFGPTAANGCPARFAFVRSPEARARLRPCLSAGNVEQTMSAPVTVIVAMDMAFHEALPRLYPHADARSWFAGKPAAIEETAFRNASLQAGYLILAARALGLDCGPMSGFDRAAVDAEFFAGSSWRSNLLVNLGYGDRARLHPRNPRLDFDEACRLL